ncbi:hypothetical protein BKA65DRAFT_514821 [Rhexocercosporidium sp. MPI-PUGE-AT-0058]|nr:hypothetical protein BKA65DRAFT_514821 [Rhexocercosporidium sp. MPI-PUGE-AT-0058]
MEVQQDTSSTTKHKPDSATTVYHVYHAGQGKHPTSYSFHSIRDSETTILSKPKVSPSTTPTPTPNPDAHIASSLTDTDSDPPSPKPLTGTQRTCKLDCPDYDPRAESTPYYLNLPSLLFHSPPYTLRNGGHKRAPVTCLLHASWRWKGWRLEFGDVLNQEGVIDGRGVVNAKFGTKDGREGMLKGYVVRKKRHWGESGKAWWVAQKEAGFPDGADFESEEGLEGKVKPEEIVTLRWKAPFSLRARNHGFEWRGFEFVWKGTRKVDVKKGARPFVFCNHLKLVVLVPEDMSPISKDAGKREMCLGKYVCVMGKRKAGRLEVYQDVIDGFLAEHILPALEGGDKEISEEERELEGEEVAKTQKRIRDVIVGTSICMVMTERNKRRFLLEILLLISDILGE